MNYVKTPRLTHSVAYSKTIMTGSSSGFANMFRDLAVKYPTGIMRVVGPELVCITLSSDETDADMAVRHVAEEAAHFAKLTEVAVQAALLAERTRISGLVEEAIAEGVVVAYGEKGLVNAPVMRAHLDAEGRMKVLAMRIGAAA